jgi:hypothetical protein
MGAKEELLERDAEFILKIFQWFVVSQKSRGVYENGC